MADEKKAQSVPQKAAEYRLPVEGLFRAYANNVALQATSFDLKLIFGEVAEISEEKVIVEHRVQITMTWLEAKVLADFLQANLRAFEETNGPLKLPTIGPALIVPETFKTPT